MPTLDYAQTQPRLSKRAIRVAIAAVAVTALLVIGWWAPGWYRQRQAARLAEAYRLIDSEVPGSEVYLRDKLLGTTPLLLTRAECAALGLPVTGGTRVDFDGWGEGVAFHDPSAAADPRLMYKAPARVAATYLNYQTPWGVRTKMAGGWDLPNGFRTKFMARGRDGIAIQIRFAAAPAPDDKVVKVLVTATHAGPTAYAGFRPEVQLDWGTFDVQWQHRSHQTFALPAEWASVAPGQSLTTTVEIPRPTTPGDYSVFATFNLFRNATDPSLVGHGSVYSDSTLMHVP